MRRLKFLVWPVLILVVMQVVAMITGQILRRRYLGQEVDEDSVNAVAVMGGLEDRVTSKAFKGGYLRAVMGGAELDLSEAIIEEKPATIEITVIMGGAEIKVPGRGRDGRAAGAARPRAGGPARRSAPGRGT